MAEFSFTEPEETHFTTPAATQRRVSRGGIYIHTYKEHDAEEEKSELSVIDKEVIKKANCDEWEQRSRRISLGGLHIGNSVKPWEEISKINFVPSTFFDVLSQAYRRCSRNIAQGPGAEIAMAFAVSKRSSGDPRTSGIFSSQALTTGILAPPPVDAPDYEHFEKLKLAKYLLNESNLWGCFYVYPDLYNEGEEFSCVPIREVGDKPGDVPVLVNGVLTRDVVGTCLTHLKRTPLLGAYVYIKLIISHMYLTNIDVLKHYKFLVYLDMNSNLLTNLDVLTHLPYLQFLSVSYNRLGTVLEYDNPQWFLTDVVYKFNSVKIINDLTKFWSLAVLDLSHNNIRDICGLENLHYLRRLDLSFNNISKLKNLNHLPLTWLDVSYNNITSFEFTDTTGLWTLLDLEYLNINENGLSSMKMFSRCNRLRELLARNNHFNRLLELAVYMRQLRRLIVLDLRDNGVCSIPGYKEVVVDTFPELLSFDDYEMDATEMRMARLELEPDLLAFTTQRLLRLLYVEQLSRSRVSHTVPPADTTEVPLVVLVGCEASGKGTLLRRLTKECPSMVDPALLHTTASFHFAESYIHVSRQKFDDMILGGELLTYSEMFGESYGLSRGEAWITNKVKVVAMDLTGALMLKLRGRKPYLILIYNHDKEALRIRQIERKRMRAIMLLDKQRKSYVGVSMDKNALQLMVSGRLLVNGIINEMMTYLPDVAGQCLCGRVSAFVVESECSLFQDSNTRQTAEAYTQAMKLSKILDNLRSNSLISNQTQELSELYQGDPRDSDEVSRNVLAEHRAFKENNERRPSPIGLTPSEELKRNTLQSAQQSANALIEGSNNSKFCHSRCVMCIGESTDQIPTLPTTDDVTETLQESVILSPCSVCSCCEATVDNMNHKIKSTSGKVASSQTASNISMATDDLDIWQAFLAEFDDDNMPSNMNVNGNTSKPNTTDPIEGHHLEFLFGDLHKKVKDNFGQFTDYYEEIHRKNPGYFWDTVAMDDPEAAFRKMKNILRDIVHSQASLQPMFAIDFINMTNFYPHIENRLDSIYKQIAPHRLFN